MIEKIIKQRTELAMIIWKAFLLKKASQSEQVLQKMAAENFYQISELSCLAWPSTVASYEDDLVLFGKMMTDEPDQNEQAVLKKVWSIEREIKGETQKILQSITLTDMMRRGLEVLAKQHEKYLSDLESEQVTIQTLAS